MGTNTAPSLAVASIVSMNAVLLSRSPATVSPCRTPRDRSARASWLVLMSSSAYVIRRSPSTSAILSPDTKALVEIQLPIPSSMRCPFHQDHLW